LKVPETLYKYTTASTAKIVLESGRLRWSNPSQFNDLHEFQIMPVFSPSLEQDWESYLLTIVDVAYSDSSPSIQELSPHTLVLLTLIRQLISTVNSKQELFNTINMSCPSDHSAMDDLLRNFTESIKNEYARVFCLTSSPTNDVMWAHYANSHTGCVLGFRHLEDLDTPFSEAKSVQYAEGSSVIGTGKDFLLYGDTQVLRQKTVEAIFYTKQMNWAYENEWRVITWQYNENDKSFGDYKFYSEELESITFGPRISDNDRGSISNILQDKYRSAKTYEIVTQNGKSERTLING
jgi:hypothetical protein